MSRDNAPRARFTDDQLNALKDRNPVNLIAGGWVRLRSKGGKRAGKYVGPCPLCSDDPQKKTSTRFECDADKWVCAVCHKGGDVIGLMQAREGIDFVGAVERLGGTREEVPTPALAKRAGKQDYGRAIVKTDNPPATPVKYWEPTELRNAYAAGWRAGASAEAYAEFARQRERARLYRFWKAGAWFAGTPVEEYLARRGYVVPANARLKFHPAMPLFCDGREDEPVLAHVGPAMLAAIIGASGKFIGLHITWLDPAGPKGKALVYSPETGEELPAKKSRGTKAGGYIDLGGLPVLIPIAGEPDFIGPCALKSYLRMIAGEGIETVLAAYTALFRAGHLRPGDGFRSGVDLGNLAGSALETVAHPTLRTQNNRPQRVPGPDPDLDGPAMPVPDTVADLFLLGDGDSDPFTTRTALERARRRRVRDRLSVHVRFADQGSDFDDLNNRAAALREEMQKETDK